MSSTEQRDPGIAAGDDPSADDPSADERSEPVEHAEVVHQEGDADKVPARTESVDQPSKIMRIGTMIKQLLEEVRNTELDEASRDRLREIYETSVVELASAMSEDLRDELDRLTSPFASNETPSGPELRLAQAQLVGWLEGLFQGIQATMFAQQMAAQQQLASMRGQLPPGARPEGADDRANARPGTYL